MEVTRRKAIAVALSVSLLFLAVSYVAFNQGTEYGINLAEDMGINRQPSIIESTVYWFVNGEFVWAEHNTMCNIGLNETRNMIADQTYVNNNASTNAFRYINIGTGSGGGASSTNLTTYFDGQIGTFAEVAGVVGNWTLTYTWTAGSFSGETITEAGVSDIALSDGSAIILNYQDFTGITLQSTDSLQVQFMFQVS